MRLKKWQVITLIALAVLCFTVLGIGFAIVVMPNTGVTPVPVAVIHTQTAPPSTPTPPVFPTPTPRPPDLPVLSRMSDYPRVAPLELLKRAYAYKDMPICMTVKAFNVKETQDGTTFNIQEYVTFAVIGTAFCKGTMPGFVDETTITIAGYVIGVESEFGGNSSRPVILVQRYWWIRSSSAYYYTEGDREFTYCPH